MFDARVGKYHKLARHCSLGKERERKRSKNFQERKKTVKGVQEGGNESKGTTVSMRSRAGAAMGQRVHKYAGK